MSPKVLTPLARILKSQKQLRRFLSKLTVPALTPVGRPVARKKAASVKPTAVKPATAKPAAAKPAAAKPATAKPAVAAKLKEVADFGSNPGGLAMFEYVPPRLGKNAPLVVILHGCLQSAQGFDNGSGWTALARENGFAVVYPEQRRNNNPNLCFNWFRPSAVARDRGELMSVRQMIDAACSRHGLDTSRIYVAGLSAGGALASALLATYPDLFAGGAIIAGLPFGAARDAMTALSVMNSGANRSAEEWGDFVRSVSPEMSRRPAISIWHGTGDRIVSIANASASLRQWLNVYGLPETAGVDKAYAWGTRRQWKDGQGSAAVSLYQISGMGHGLPLKRAVSPSEPDKFMLNAGISAPVELADVWGLKKP